MDRRRAKPTIPLTEEQRELAGRNTGLAYHAVRKLNSDKKLGHLEVDEADSLALEELCIAARLYRPDYVSPSSGKVVMFSTFAISRIEDRIRSEKSRRADRIIHVPGWHQWSNRPEPKHQKAKARRERAVEQAKAAQCIASVSSMDSDVEPRDHREPVGFSADETCPDDVVPVWEALDQLPDRLRRVVIERVLGRRTLRDVGRDMGGLSRERVRQLQERALGILRDDLGSQVKRVRVKA